MPGSARPAVFLDRDGVVNESPERKCFVKTIDDFRLLPGVVDAVRSLKQAGYLVWVLSNQSGVATGEIKLKDLEAITAEMERLFTSGAAALDGVLYCTHVDANQCDCRKPKSGLYHLAAKRSAINFEDSFSVGDQERDLVAAKAVKCRTILVLTGGVKKADIASFGSPPDAVKDSLSDAATWILDQQRS